MTRLPTIRSAADIAAWAKKRRRVVSIGSRGDWFVHPRATDYTTKQHWGRTAQSAIRKAEKQLKRTK